MGRTRTTIRDESGLRPEQVRNMGRGAPFGLGGGGKALFAPLPPAGALAWLVPQNTASDAAHLVPCVDGDLVRWWKDAVSGTWYEQAASGNRFTYRAGAGKPYLDTTAAGAFHLIGPNSTGVRTVGAAVRHVTNSSSTINNLLTDNTGGFGASTFRKNPNFTPWENTSFFNSPTIYVNDVATAVSGGQNADEVVVVTDTLSGFSEGGVIRVSGDPGGAGRDFLGRVYGLVFGTTALTRSAAYAALRPLYT